MAFATKGSQDYHTKKFHKTPAETHVSTTKYLRHCLINLNKADTPLDHFNTTFDPDITLVNNDTTLINTHSTHTISKWTSQALLYHIPNSTVCPNYNVSDIV
jgi:hypothetical protein